MSGAAGRACASRACHRRSAPGPHPSPPSCPLGVCSSPHETREVGGWTRAERTRFSRLPPGGATVARMGKRFRRRSHDETAEVLLAELPAAFTLHDLLASVPEREVRRALTWLYAGIERGEILVDGDGFPIVYQLAVKLDPRGPAAA